MSGPFHRSRGGCPDAVRSARLDQNRGGGAGGGRPPRVLLRAIGNDRVLDRAVAVVVKREDLRVDPVALAVCGTVPRYTHSHRRSPFRGRLLAAHSCGHRGSAYAGPPPPTRVPAPGRELDNQLKCDGTYACRYEPSVSARDPCRPERGAIRRRHPVRDLRRAAGQPAGSLV